MATPKPEGGDLHGAGEEAVLWHSWRDAAGDPMIDAAIRGLYADLDAAVRARGPTCWVSGRCCHFDAFGHRLYVTGLEIAWVVKQVGALSSPSPPPPDTDGGGAGGCRFQKDKLCTIHAVRPLGCRVFFCQEGTQTWQQNVYEQFLARLRVLHDHHGLPYRYMEWRVGLAAAIDFSHPVTSIPPTGG
jgi:Fe-S-cluster containining protein